MISSNCDTCGQNSVAATACSESETSKNCCASDLQYSQRSSCGWQRWAAYQSRNASRSLLLAQTPVSPYPMNAPTLHCLLRFLLFKFPASARLCFLPFNLPATCSADSQPKSLHPVIVRIQHEHSPA